MPIHDHIEAQYLRIMPQMMENPQVWEVIKNRDPEQKDNFLYDRFMSSCRHAFQYLKEGNTYDEWMEHCTISRAVEPPLAQAAYEAAREIIKINRANHDKNACLISIDPEIAFPLSRERHDARVSMQIQEEMGFTANYVYQGGEITYNGDPLHESRWLDKEREIFNKALSKYNVENKTIPLQIKPKDTLMDYGNHVEELADKYIDINIIDKRTLSATIKELPKTPEKENKHTLLRSYLSRNEAFIMSEFSRKHEEFYTHLRIIDENIETIKLAPNKSLKFRDLKTGDKFDLVDIENFTVMDIKEPRYEKISASKYKDSTGKNYTIETPNYRVFAVKRNQHKSIER